MSFQVPLVRGTKSEVLLSSAQEEICFREPLTLGSENNDWFWRENTIFMKVQRGSRQICSNTVSASTSRKLISCGPATQGVIFDETGFYSHAGFLSLGNLQKIKCENGIITFFGDEHFLHGSYVHVFDGNSHNYFHWLIEGIPALFALREAGIKDRALFLGKEHVTRWHKEYLEIMEEDCVLIDSLLQDTVSVEKAYWTDDRYLDTLPPSRLLQVGSYFRNKVDPSPFKRVYIKRHSALARSVENAAEIENFLTNIGFVVVDLGCQSVRNQIALFSGAEIVIGAHGAGLANLIFMKATTLILEILPDGHEVRNLFWILANKADIRYAFIRANVNDLHGPYGSTLRVPLQDLKNMLGLIDEGLE